MTLKTEEEKGDSLKLKGELSIQEHRNCARLRMSSSIDLNALTLSLGNPADSVSRARNTSRSAQQRDGLEQAAVPEGSPSTIVNIGGLNGSIETDLIYDASDLASAPSTSGRDKAWQNPATDAVSAQIAKNFDALNTPGRYSGLGQALLERFKTTQDDFKQALTDFSSASMSPRDVAEASAAAFERLTSTPSNKITLSIRTVSGVAVNLVVSSRSNGLGVEISSSDTLSQVERDALASMSGAFEKALNALVEQPPRVDIGDLGNFDTAVLKSVDLKALVTQETGQTFSLEFHSDSTARSLKATGAGGEINISLDLTKPAIWGAEAQRNKAISHYLKQFDAAAERGKGNAELVRLFKDSFTGLHASYPPAASSVRNIATSAAQDTLEDTEQALLTGLADFKAQITEEIARPNPQRHEEIDQFSFGTAQTSRIKHDNSGGQTITQEQTSKLIASFHTQLTSDEPPLLGDKKETQNYRYYQIDDSASSTALIAHDADNNPVSASLEKAANQSLHLQRYELGKLTDEETRPIERTSSDNLLQLITSLHNNKPKTADEVAERADTLERLNDKIFLESSALSPLRGQDLHALIA